MRTIAPGLDQKIPGERPEPSEEELQKVKDGKTAKCNCGHYPKWYCDVWPRCVQL